MALSCSDDPVSYDSVTVSQHAQYKDPETEEAIFNKLIYTCDFPTVTCQHVCEKRQQFLFGKFDSSNKERSEIRIHTLFLHEAHCYLLMC